VDITVVAINISKCRYAQKHFNPKITWQIAFPCPLRHTSRPTLGAGRPAPTQSSARTAIQSDLIHQRMRNPVQIVSHSLLETSTGVGKAVRKGTITRNHTTTYHKPHHIGRLQQCATAQLVQTAKLAADILTILEHWDASVTGQRN